MLFQIVVARYNENIEYLSYLAPICMIYNKGETSIPYFFKNIINLPNIGRETHTYLYHIINNYDNLAENTLFIQGKIDDHQTFTLIEYMKNINIMAKKREIAIEKLKKKINHDKKYLDELKLSVITPFDFITKILNIKFESINKKKIPIIWGANFCVSKSLILSKSIEYYKNLIKYVEYDKNPEEGHFFERSWYIIFNYPYFKKDIRYYYFINTSLSNIQYSKLFTKLNTIINNKIDIWSSHYIDPNILKEYNIKISYLNSNQFFIIYPTINYNLDNNEYSFEFNYDRTCIILFIFEKDIYEFRFDKNVLEVFHHNTNLTLANIKLIKFKKNNNSFLFKWSNYYFEINNLLKFPIFLKNPDISLIKIMGNDCFIEYSYPYNKINYFFTTNNYNIQKFYLYNYIENYTIPFDDNMLLS